MSLFQRAFLYITMLHIEVSPAAPQRFIEPSCPSKVHWTLLPSRFIEPCWVAQDSLNLAAPQGSMSPAVIQSFMNPAAAQRSVLTYLPHEVYWTLRPLQVLLNKMPLKVHESETQESNLEEAKQWTKSGPKITTLPRWAWPAGGWCAWTRLCGCYPARPPSMSAAWSWGGARPRPPPVWTRTRTRLRRPKHQVRLPIYAGLWIHINWIRIQLPFNADPDLNTEAWPFL